MIANGFICTSGNFFGCHIILFLIILFLRAKSQGFVNPLDEFVLEWGYRGWVNVSVFGLRDMKI